MLRDFLDRFRPAGAPGAAGAVGVPADRLAGIEEELAPLFSALADIEQRCAQIRERAERDAARHTDQSRRMATAILARARSQAEAERAAAAADARSAVEAESAGTADDAQRAADDVRSAAERRIPALVGEVLSRARKDVEAAAAGRP